MTSCYVLGFEQLDQRSVAVVGGKAAHLAELSRLEGIRVPAGFCITTDAFRRITAQARSLDERLEALSRLKPSDQPALRGLSAEVRRILEAVALPDDVAAQITAAHARLGEHAAYAVRSSATAEDSPTASFAGQQETYLNIVSQTAILHHVRRCWASLFTERAVTYRLRHGFDERKVQMAVVVQRMLVPYASGILFTADPVTGNRKISCVEASFGLGEALVGGLVNADAYQVCNGEIVAKTIGTKWLIVNASPTGGTQQQPLETERRTQPALSDEQVLRLEQLGRRIETHFGRPQDIEWCLVDDDLHVVQSRPITTLFPIPAAADDQHHVYVSVGHQQMMTDAFKPLGLSMWQLKTSRPMAEAGGRLFVDVTPMLASAASRTALLATLGKSDPLIGDALQNILRRNDFIPAPQAGHPAWTPPGAGSATLETDPAIVSELVARSQASLADLKSAISAQSGAALLDFILADIQASKHSHFDPKSLQVVMAAIEAAGWINDHLATWLGEKNAADALTQSVPGNVTSEMGLALLDVADVIRPHAQLVAFLQHVDDDDFLQQLPRFTGGREAQAAIRDWLNKYGMRGVGEIDITRPRFCEHPTVLLPLLLGNVNNCEPGAAKRRFEQGQKHARQRERELLERLRALPDGQQKAEQTKHQIDRVRTFAGYREYPKYAMICRDFVYKQALLTEAERLVRAGVLREKDDVFYLRFEELQQVVRTQQVNEALLHERKDAFRKYQALTPPRVLTSGGEAIAGAYRREDVPPSALVGLPVCAGHVEGRARVILSLAEVVLEEGDILVTAFTDPSWSPWFVAIKGLVTEVGGLMTHGAVIAREYGLPAVVGVVNATLLIKDGQRIRVNGTDGYVEILA